MTVHPYELPTVYCIKKYCTVLYFVRKSLCSALCSSVLSSVVPGVCRVFTVNKHEQFAFVYLFKRGLFNK